MHCESDEEFRMRVQQNFKVYVLLTSKTLNWKLEDILRNIYKLNGYKCHKTVKYGENTSHIHVRFNEEYMASEAVDFLNNLNTDLTAVLVDDMLRDWFSYELRSAFSPHGTLTIVDIVGKPPLSLNFLTENILNSIFRNFGNTYLLPYTAALNEPHVQILFGSMTEALAACMAFGEWREKGVNVDSFSYRVRINPSEKEAMLIKNSGGIPKEAFKLDYFVNVRKELINNQRINEPDPKQKMSRIKTSSSQSKGPQRARKQKYIPVVNAEPKQCSFGSYMGHRTPILCVPVIAPLNSYAEAFMSTNRHLNGDFANAMLNIQQSCAVSTLSIGDNSDSEIEFRQSIQYESFEETSRCRDITSSEQPTITLEDETPPDIILNSVPEKVVVPRQEQHALTKPKRNNHKGSGKTSNRRR